MADTDITLSRTCTKCGLTKPADTQHFNRNPKGKHGLKAWCRDCTRAARDIQRAGHKVGQPREEWPDGFKRCSRCSELKLATAEFFYPHREGRLGLHAHCKGCFLAQRKDSYEANRGDRPKRRFTPWQSHELKSCVRCGKAKLASTKNFRVHRELPGGLQPACRPCEREYFRENSHRWADSRRANVRNYRSRKQGAEGKHTAADIKALLKGQRGRCWWCRKKMTEYHVDHRIPLSRGGSNDVSNLVIACPTCNVSRNNRLPWEMSNPRLL